MQEQRRETRVPLRLEVQWNGWENQSPDVTSDVSLSGCYIESLNSVTVGEVLNLGLRLPSKEILPIRCEVRYHQPTIGFGIRFLQLSSVQRDALAELIAYSGAMAYAA
jgi:PilZ domain-containing protein